MQERCSELNREGKPCGGWVLSDGKCWNHGGRSSSSKPTPSKPKRLELTEELGRKIAEGEATAVVSILEAAAEDWRAAAWFLERAHPERWGKVSTRLREPNKPPEEREAPPPLTESELGTDPFAEVDELAQRRTRAES